MSDQHVRDVMTRAVVAATPDCDYQHVIDVLADFAVSGMPVVNEDDHVIGVLSEADVLRPRPGQTARDMMTSPALTITAGATVGVAAQLMTEHQLRRLPVVDDDTGRLVGIVTRRDLLRRAMRSDRAIERDIEDHVLLRAPWLDPASVGIKVDAGAVTLTGTVDRRSTARLLAYLVRAIDGVTAVVDELRSDVDDVRPAGRLAFDAERP